MVAITMNQKLNLPIAANQTAVIQNVLDMLTAGSNFSETVMEGKNPVNGTFNINVRLCYPQSTMRLDATTVQFLTRAIGFDKSYWDFADGYSYINVAVSHGYAPFDYDRLGVGVSDHPNAKQIVQAPLKVSIAHSLVQMLCAGKFTCTKFKHVDGTGHSFGSTITQSVTEQYPADLDAAVLTGFSFDSTGLPIFTAALGLTLAKEADPLRFPSLSNGYLVVNDYPDQSSQNSFATQFAFFHAQGFPPSNLDLANSRRQTVTFAELLTTPEIIKVATNFTGAVHVVNGLYDFPFCQGNCLYPTNLAAEVKKALYPVAKNSSSYYLAEGAGHGLDFYYGAKAAFLQIQTLVKAWNWFILVF